MKVSGFTFIKNGLTLGYPIKESVESLAPLCDEVIINVGFDDINLEKDDGTFEYLKKSFPEKKYKFLKNYWDPKLKVGGLILSQQTNLALKECQGDYCLYIQGDEAIHEKDFTAIKKGIKSLDKNQDLDGILFKYLHFYGNVNIVKKTRDTYRQEVRLIRNHKGIKSWQDAQGFRHNNNTKIKVLPISATIFHYGWARSELVMDKKIRNFGKLYHGDNHQEKEQFQYKRIWGLKEFKETHPQVMGQWIKQNKNDLELMSLKRHYKLKDLGAMLSDLIEYFSGHRLFEYKNFKLK